MCILKELSFRCLLSRARYLNSKMVLEDDYISLICLVVFLNIFSIFYLLHQKVAKFPAFCWTVWDSKSYFIGQFQIFCYSTPGLKLGVNKKCALGILEDIQGNSCRIGTVRHPRTYFFLIFSFSLYVWFKA